MGFLGGQNHSCEDLNALIPVLRQPDAINIGPMLLQVYSGQNAVGFFFPDKSSHLYFKQYFCVILASLGTQIPFLSCIEKFDEIGLFFSTVEYFPKKTYMPQNAIT